MVGFFQMLLDYENDLAHVAIRSKFNFLDVSLGENIALRPSLFWWTITRGRLYIVEGENVYKAASKFQLWQDNV